MKLPRTENETPNSQSGFSLIETTIALLVMMVGALACTSLFVFSLQNNVGGSERALAMAVAQQQLEQIRSVNYDDGTLTAGTITSTVRNGERNYTVQRTVVDETNPVGGAKQLKRITITVTPQTAGAAWMRTPVVLVSQRSTIATGNYLVVN
ncbi:MAG TPA: type II secretion system protein [Pyrinomonadaceae bacterium]|jgi:Tfp pilus assembly protein PilV|nr:type II secretion system protein [Pyrinomonadaceae bacterium]